MAIVFTFLLVLLWLLIGQSFFSAFNYKANYHLRLLTSPAVGLAINLIALFAFSRLGLPVKYIAPPLLTISLLFSAHFILSNPLAWKNVKFFSFVAFLFIGLLPFSLALTRFGFEWLAFVNGDMHFYSLSAQRFFEFGFSELPASGLIYDESNYALQYWHWTNELGHRVGAEMMLSYLMGVTGLTAHQIYMPLNIAIHICVAAGSATLVLLGSKKWDISLCVMLLVAISPMLTLQVTMQILAQSFGLTFLTGLCAAYFIAVDRENSRVWVYVTVILFCGLCIAYSELVPFFGLYVLLSECIKWRKWREKSSRAQMFKSIVMMAIGTFVILNSYLIDVIYFVFDSLFGSFSSSVMTTQSDGVSLFPHFLIPSGGAMMFGWLSLGESANSFVIVIGLLSFLVLIGFVVKSSRKNLAAAQMVLIMTVVSIPLYIGQNGFGLFKIAMFIQPFLIATVCLLINSYVRSHILNFAILSLLGLSIIPAQYRNINKVVVPVGQARVPYASADLIGENLRNLRDELINAQFGKKVYSDTTITEFFNLITYYLKDIVFRPLSLPAGMRELVSLNNKDIIRFSNDLEQNIKFEFSSNELIGKSDASFVDINYEGLEDDLLITAGGKYSIINRSNKPFESKLYLQPVKDLENYLIFRQTSLGTSYFFYTNLDRDGRTPVLFDLEKDPMFGGMTMAAVGRRHVYEVIHPKVDSRLLLSLSSSFIRNSDFRLPKVMAFGEESISLPLVGRGSARVVSESLIPKELGGKKYLGLDFGRDPVFLDKPRSGPMGWFGKEIKIDVRKTAIFSRDISYITREQYDSIDPPFEINEFPSGLGNPGLEYSGIFEDGWMSEAAYVFLGVPRESRNIFLHFSGLVPDVGDNSFETEITVKFNGEVVYSEIRLPGDLNLDLPIAGNVNTMRKVKVEIYSSALQRLPNGDDRPVSLLVREIGLLAK